MYSLLAMCLALCPEPIDEHVEQLLKEKLGDKIYNLNQQYVLELWNFFISSLAHLFFFFY